MRAEHRRLAGGSARQFVHQQAYKFFAAEAGEKVIGSHLGSCQSARELTELLDAAAHVPAARATLFCCGLRHSHWHVVSAGRCRGRMGACLLDGATAAPMGRSHRRDEDHGKSRNSHHRC
jgi:hypothetical protein